MTVRIDGSESQTAKSEYQLYQTKNLKTSLQQMSIEDQFVFLTFLS